MGCSINTLLLKLLKNEAFWVQMKCALFLKSEFVLLNDILHGTSLFVLQMDI